MKLFDIFQHRLGQVNQININLMSLYIFGISDNEYDFLKNFLSDDELNRSSSFNDIENSKKYVASRVFAKFILASILKIEITSINFNYCINGKPYLEDRSIFFNISHSKDFCVIGTSFVQEIGVDIEFIDENIDYITLLRLFAYQEEIQWVLEKNSVRRFYELWTLKESILKYTGKGISDECFPKLFLENNKLLYPNTKIDTFTFTKSDDYVISLCTGVM
jgi:4'-phosphopantetheinyl transferase